nr:BCL2 associated X, apoptosis regulator a isoform X2 [Misgurnus anguillicaudatus]
MAALSGRGDTVQSLNASGRSQRYNDVLCLFLELKRGRLHTWSMQAVAMAVTRCWTWEPHFLTISSMNGFFAMETAMLRMLNDTALQPTKDVFVKVALEIFSDGKFNWGRVVALFYFACRLVIKAITTKIPDIIRTIISWTMSYIQEHVINWIREQGGWEGIRSYFGTPTWQTIGVFLAGVLTTVLVIRKM